MSSSRSPALQALLVSDDGPFLRLLRALLAESGLDTHGTNAWRTVPREAARLHVRLVLLDIGVMHPERATLALLALRRAPSTATVPVIVTAPAAWLLEERADLLHRCRAEVWRDPCHFESLLLTIHELLPLPAAVSTGPGSRSIRRP